MTSVVAVVPPAIDGEQHLLASGGQALIVDGQRIAVQRIFSIPATTVHVVAGELWAGLVAAANGEDASAVLVGAHAPAVFSALLHRATTLDAPNATAVCYLRRQDDAVSSSSDGAPFSPAPDGVVSASFACGSARIAVTWTAGGDVAAAAGLLVGNPRSAVVVCPSNAQPATDIVALFRAAAHIAQPRLVLGERSRLAQLAAQLKAAEEEVADLEAERELLEAHVDTTNAALEKERTARKRAQAVLEQHAALAARPAAADGSSRASLASSMMDGDHDEHSSLAKRTGTSLKAALKERDEQARSIAHLRDELAEANATIEQLKDTMQAKARNELRLVGEFQAKERTWQAALVQAEEDKRKLASDAKSEQEALMRENQKVRALAQQQLASFNQATEMIDREMAADHNDIQLLIERVRSLSPPRVREFASPSTLRASEVQASTRSASESQAPPVPDARRFNLLMSPNVEPPASPEVSPLSPASRRAVHAREVSF